MIWSDFVSRIRAVWLLYQEAITWSTTPADYFGVEDEYTAYCFNQAVTYVGKYIESKMDEAGSKVKNGRNAEAARRRMLNKYLSAGEPKAKPRFMDPATLIAN